MTASVEFSLNQLSTLKGFISGALVDSQTGATLGIEKGNSYGDFNIDIAAAGNAKVMNEKLKTIHDLGLDDELEDIVIILGKQFHIIRPLKGASGVFMYCVLNRQESDLPFVRESMEKLTKQINIQAITV